MLSTNVAPASHCFFSLSIAPTIVSGDIPPVIHSSPFHFLGQTVAREQHLIRCILFCSTVHASRALYLAHLEEIGEGKGVPRKELYIEIGLSIFAVYSRAYSPDKSAGPVPFIDTIPICLPRVQHAFFCSSRHHKGSLLRHRLIQTRDPQCAPSLNRSTAFSDRILCPEHRSTFPHRKVEWNGPPTSSIVAYSVLVRQRWPSTSSVSQRP